MRKEGVKNEGDGVKMSLRPERTSRAANEPRTAASEALERLLAPPRRRQAVAGIVVAVAGPVLATLLGSAISPGRTGVPALLFLVAVVAAAAVARLWPALLSAAISFVLLDYYFTPPFHTFRVGKGENLVALAVFMVVAVAVSAAIARVVDQRGRAEFREHQVRALYHVVSRLLSGQPLDSVLGDLAASIRALYGLAGCRVLVADGDGTLHERAASGQVTQGHVSVVPLRAHGRLVGQIELSGRGGQDPGENEVLQTFAAQLALALELGRLGREAEASRVEAESNRIRAALFSSVTHDLRTPLASITASASSLLEEGVPFSDEQRQELLRTILEESVRMNRLVGDLLDLSRLRAGALTPSVERVPLEDVVSAVVERLRSVLADRPFRVMLREDIPPVPVDVMQVDQVLTNLLENAVRYSPPGSEISLTATKWHDSVEVRVSDRGPGISKPDRERVFQEFYRSDVGDRRGGTGLGLTIAQAVVAAHGGTMWIEETPGGGATVGFRLPLGDADSGDGRPGR